MPENISYCYVCISNMKVGSFSSVLPIKNVADNIWLATENQNAILNNFEEYYKCNAKVSSWGWSGGAKVLGKVSVLGLTTNLDNSRARAYCACSRCEWGCFSLVYHFFLLSPSLWETARYRLKYCLKGPLSPKQPTNQPI